MAFKGLCIKLSAVTLLRRSFLATITGSLLSLFGGSAEAAVGPLIKPTRLGQTVIFRNKLYTCIKQGKKLVWNQGVPIKGYTKPTASASPTPTPSNTASALILVAKLSDLIDGQSKIIEVKATGAASFSVAVSRQGSNYEVLSAICTHRGCTVEATKSELVCPCHGSAFNAVTGAVNAGPAGSPLKKYAWSVDSGNLYIKP